MKKILILIGSLMIGGCSLPLTPELVEALSHDTASFCAKAGVRGGAGAATLAPVPVPAGGYGSADLEFCRSNFPGAKVTLAPDGSISIEHQK